MQFCFKGQDTWVVWIVENGRRDYMQIFEHIEIQEKVYGAQQKCNWKSGVLCKSRKTDGLLTGRYVLSVPDTSFSDYNAVWHSPEGGQGTPQSHSIAFPSLRYCHYICNQL